MFLKYTKLNKNVSQIIAIAIGCLTCANSGMAIAWSSPFIIKITEDKENYNISEEEASYFTVLNVLGLLISLPFTNLLPDKLGRKPTLMLSSLPYSLCWIFKILFSNVYLLYLARFSTGIGDALMFASLPLYIGEVATPEVRGIWGNGLIVFGFFGQFLITVFGHYFTVRLTSLICLTVPILFVLLFSFMPESPYYYAMKDRNKEGVAALRILRLRDDVEEEYKMLKYDVDRQISESGTWKDLILIQSNRRALMAGIFLRITLVMSGILVFISYSQFIFNKSGGNIDASTASIIYMGLGFVLYTISSIISEKLGRKKSFTISLCLTSIILLLEGGYFYLDEHCPNLDLSNFKWFPLTGMIIFLVCVSFGVGILPGLMLSELFSVSIKVKAISVVIMCYSVMFLLSNMFFYRITLVTGLCGPFFIFGIFDVVAAILTQFIVPETKGKTLEDIQQNLKSN